LNIEFEGGDEGKRNEEQQVAADLYYGSHDGNSEMKGECNVLESL
jgi:hypothetical protein